MSTIKSLAEDLGANPAGLREFAPDLLPTSMSDLDEVPEEDEATIREAWAAASNHAFDDES